MKKQLPSAEIRKNPSFKDDVINRPIYPARIIVLSFLAVILIGAILLMMPFSSKSGEFTDPLTATFTATTSTCVTGLVVVDTGDYWSTFGQAVILLLIQIGGLGLVTLTTFFIVVFRQKIGLGGMELARSSVGSSSFQNLNGLVKLIVITTLSIEALGAALLSIRFIPLYGVGKGIWMSVFTAISAYCNAGLDLFEGEYTSLTAFSGDWLVTGVIMALIVIGGLGFLVYQDIFAYRKRKKLMLHTKIVLLFTAVLIITGAIFIFAFEFSNKGTLGDLSFSEKILASLFQSITMRTAGFNTVDLGTLSDPSKLISCILMFIGAAPGSTAGGIKITTFIVVLMTVLTAFMNRSETIIFHRRIRHSTVYKALSIMSVGAVIIGIASAVLMVENPGIETVDILFESFSAFATVGVTTGITPTLGIVSKIVIILTMFLGRVGTFSIFMALTLREQEEKTKTVLPEGEIMVG